jgi:hypothetical protein
MRWANVFVKLMYVVAVIVNSIFSLISSHITRQAQYEHPCAPVFYAVRRIPSPAYLHRFPPGSALSSRESLPEPRLAPRRDQQPHHTEFKPPSVLVPGSPYNIQGTNFIFSIAICMNSFSAHC